MKKFKRNQIEKEYVTDIQVCPKEGEVFCRIQFIGGNDFIVVPAHSEGKVVFIKKSHEYLITWNKLQCFEGWIINNPSKNIALFIPDNAFPVTGSNIRDNVLRKAV